ncbi:hypothetical protein EWM64_g7421 [Hericium alpestre]|uniref:TPX2 C-terminal domain-containing protein n=1 Tax=Hericium alpestre TaxID=135208 RepID=A0A4Y9ZP97_9AGAM|nr:hypothetical protein EWM64_g7421 [Hericium alpestre]
MPYPEASRFTSADFSMRHLPDASDTSMSFQIPLDAHLQSRLVDENSHDFLDGLDANLITPVPPRGMQSPLTLGELTPQHKLKVDLEDALSSTLVEPFTAASSSKQVDLDDAAPMTFPIPSSSKQSAAHEFFEQQYRESPRRRTRQMSRNDLDADPPIDSKPKDALEKTGRKGRSKRVEIIAPFTSSGPSESSKVPELQYQESPKRRTRSKPSRDLDLKGPVDSKSKDTVEPSTGWNGRPQPAEVIAPAPPMKIAEVPAPSRKRAVRSKDHISCRDGVASGEEQLPLAVPTSARPANDVDSFNTAPPSRPGHMLPSKKEGGHVSDKCANTLSERRLLQTANPFGGSSRPESDRNAVLTTRPQAGTSSTEQMIEPKNQDDLGPLTVSQLSPRKQMENVGYSEDHPPPSPTRPGRKRSASPSTDIDQPRKVSGRGSKSEEGRQAKRIKTLEPSVVKNTVAPRARSAQLPSAQQASLGRRPVTGSRRKAAPPSLKNSGTLRSSRERGRTASADQWQDLSRPQPGLMQMQMPDLRKPSVTLPLTKPTVPMGFHFSSDARIEARKQEGNDKATGSSSKRAGRNVHPIPDFKAMHAAEAERAAARREQIVPAVPLPIYFSTEARLKEREKFDELRRAKELELERQKEERRLQQELEEQKEVRELRKKAVPKANVVPDWYALAPKRKGES